MSIGQFDVPENLEFISAYEHGFKRIKRGRGFQYLNYKNEPLKDEKVLNRIKALVIPPAWTQVWISPNANSHLQATGLDFKFRKQYLYHQEWKEWSTRKKFDRMAAFAKSLPSIRKQVNTDLNKKSWPKTKVIALIVNLLDTTGMRIGNTQYKEENGTYGLSTLRKKHLKIDEEGLRFEYKAKGGLYRKVQVKGKKLKRLIRECSELRGYEIFRYLDHENKAHPVYSHDVNEYLRDISGQAFTAKDFRTWSGTVLAIQLLQDACIEQTASPRKSLEVCLIKKVSEQLGNTVKICRDYYIHPAVLNAMTDHPALEKLSEKAIRKYQSLHPGLKPMEYIALYLIEKRN